MLSVFSLQNAVCFIILTYLVPVLFTFYIQDVLKLKKDNSGAKSLTKRLACVNGVHYTCACSSNCRLLVISYFGMKNMLPISKCTLLGDDFILLSSCNKKYLPSHNDLQFNKGNQYYLHVISNFRVKFSRPTDDTEIPV